MGEDFIPAKRLQYCIVKTESRSFGNISMGIEPTVRVRYELGRIRSVDTDGKILEVTEHNNSMKLYGQKWILPESMKPRHVRALPRTRWDDFDAIKGDIDLVLGDV